MAKGPKPKIPRADLGDTMSTDYHRLSLLSHHITSHTHLCEGLSTAGCKVSTAVHLWSLVYCILYTALLAQADVAKALNKDDDSVDDEPEDEENDSDAESTSSFGLEQDDEAAKPAKRRRTKETTAANTKPTEAVARVPKPEIPGSSTKDDTPRPKVKAKASAASGKEEKLTRAQKAKQDRADRCYSTATKAFTAIKEISTDMVWRSVIRTGEVERRVQKCYQAHAELEAQVAEGQFAGNAEVAAVCEEMPKRALLLTQTKDLCKGIRGSTPDSMAKDVATCGEVSTLFLTVFGSVVSDIPSTNDMLQTVAKKLHAAARNMKTSPD